MFRMALGRFSISFLSTKLLTPNWHNFMILLVESKFVSTTILTFGKLPIKYSVANHRTCPGHLYVHQDNIGLYLLKKA